MKRPSYWKPAPEPEPTGTRTRSPIAIARELAERVNRTLTNPSASKEELDAVPAMIAQIERLRSDHNNSEQRQ
jgi:hypothetical protein